MDKRSTLLVVVLVLALAVGGYYHRQKLTGYLRPVLTLVGLSEQPAEESETEQVAMEGEGSGPAAGGETSSDTAERPPEPAVKQEQDTAVKSPEPLPEPAGETKPETGPPGTGGDTAASPEPLDRAETEPPQPDEVTAETTPPVAPEDDESGTGEVDSEPTSADASETDPEESSSVAGKSESDESGSDEPTETGEVSGKPAEESESEGTEKQASKSDEPVADEVKAPSGTGERITYSEIGRFPVSDPPEGYRKAREHFQAGNHAEAKKQLEKLVKRFPKSANVNFMLGVIFFDRGEFDLARPYFKKSAAQEYDPQIRAWSREYLNRISRE